MAFAEKRGRLWRGRYRRPDGSWASTSGHRTKSAALADAEDEESRIRHNTWVDRRDAGMLFGAFADEWFEAVRPRLAPTTAAKYRSFLDQQLLPQWRSWPMIGIFNGYVEIEKWISELHEEHAESSVASYFALFSTIMNVAVRARIVPANPCYGMRVSSGGHEPERLVATPVQAVRAAMRLYDAGLGLSGFMLCVMNLYTGARWGELAGQQRGEYDRTKRSIEIREPLKEVAGRLTKGMATAATDCQPSNARPRRRVRRGAGTKTPAGTRWVKLPSGVATLYEALIDSVDHPFVFVSREGQPWYRSNFRERYWRPAWDGHRPDEPTSLGHTTPILRWFTFHEGRHSHATWLAEDGIPEVARRARLGQTMRGMARIYDHVTPAMEQQISDALEARWTQSLQALSHREQQYLAGLLPQLRPLVTTEALQHHRDPRS